MEALGEELDNRYVKGVPMWPGQDDEGMDGPMEKVKAHVAEHGLPKRDDVEGALFGGDKNADGTITCE